jgi:UDPglucose 6-dehydrogenase
VIDFKPKLGIIGYGFVGQAVVYGFSNAELHIFDKFKEGLESLEDVTTKSEFIFICLPTPIKTDGTGIDLAIIEENLDQLTKITDNSNKIIVIKSTIVPGTTDYFAKKYPNSSFAYNPEFLTEANYLQDFVNADRTIVGAYNDTVSERVVALYMQQFPKTPVFKTDPTTAEMVKYMSNSYLATKVSFANEMYQIAEKLNIKYEEVKKMVVADHRIFDSHLDVTSMRGFGGKCLPKDLLALKVKANQLGVFTDVLDAVWAKNMEVRSVHDWEDIPFAVTKVEKKTA